jgi:phosphopantetheinyl transferase
MRLPISLSISHSRDLALCALYSAGGRWQVAGARWHDEVVDDGMRVDGLVQIGVDIEGVESRSDAFVQAYFAEEEMRWIGQALDDEQAVLSTATWSAKEAVLKALHLGLTVDTRQVVCLPATGMELTAGKEHGWNEVHVQFAPALLVGALRRASIPTSRQVWEVRGWWRRQGQFVLTAALLWQEVLA